MPDTVGVGMLGYGFMAAAHLAGLGQVPNARVTAIAGPNRERASAVAAAHGVPVGLPRRAGLAGRPVR